MGTTKSDKFSEGQNHIANMIKALGHPARIAIVEYLLKVNACICGDIVNELPLAQSTISQHLKELKNVGIIKGSIEGTAVCYCLDADELNKLSVFFTNISLQLRAQNKCC